MRNDLLITPVDHPNFSQDNYLFNNMAYLLEQQNRTWELCAKNYEALNNVKVKKFYFDDTFEVKVQFNPARVISSTAKVDANSIKERKCFLCHNHLPSIQKGFLYKNEYLVLVNPYPIFQQHFTIPHINHIPQSIFEKLGDMLDLSNDLDLHYVVFYNGPKCGASAPDHFHFQAGQRNFMPIDNDFDFILDKYVIDSYNYNDIAIYVIGEKYLRPHFMIISHNKEKIIQSFEKLYNSMKTTDEEPLMNILVYRVIFKGELVWRVVIFPRKKHRPDCYFAEDETRLVVSPASVDIGGVLITPFENDFDKITKEHIKNIYAEVTLSDDEILSLYKNFINKN